MRGIMAICGRVSKAGADGASVSACDEGEKGCSGHELPLRRTRLSLGGEKLNSFI